MIMCLNKAPIFPTDYRFSELDLKIHLSMLVKKWLYQVFENFELPPNEQIMIHAQMSFWLQYCTTVLEMNILIYWSKSKFYWSWAGGPVLIVRTGTNMLQYIL